MKRILEYLSTDGAFLYEEHGFALRDSEYIDSFGGTGSVTLSNDLIELMFWLDRDRLFLDVRGLESHSTDSWYSMDIISELLTGEVSDTAAMNATNTTFLREQFQEIQDRFMHENLQSTESTCSRLKRNRAKRIFG